MTHNRSLSILVIAFVSLLCVCEKEKTGATPATTRTSTVPTMNFTVEEVFYIKPPVDRVILVGTITEGVVRVGDKLVVHTSAGPVDVVVDNIESYRQGDLKQASKGQQVGLRLMGIRQDQPSRGDRVTGSI
jgi:translation elongation factor EF-1alpha